MSANAPEDTSEQWGNAARRVLLTPMSPATEAVFLRIAKEAPRSDARQVALEGLGEQGTPAAGLTAFLLGALGTAGSKYEAYAARTGLLALAKRSLEQKRAIASGVQQLLGADEYPKYNNDAKGTLERLLGELR